MRDKEQKIKTHIFAICAYQESQYLEECIRSILQQSAETDVLIATSTPNAYISSLSDKYNIPVYVNTGESGITQDWNFAASCCKGYKYLTIAHQDDWYHKDYTKNLLEYIKKVKKPLIFFTDYAEIRDEKIINSNINLKIKRILLSPLRHNWNWNNIFIRRRVLSLGNPICCPSVTFVQDNLPKPLFLNNFKASEDWEAWERYSKIDGAFVFCNKILTYHRIHNESETTKLINNNIRSYEDRVMFGKFWPDFAANILAKIYSNSEKSNHT